MSQICPDCGDSPLSTTGNVLGILTFALGFLASCLAFVTVTRSARQEVQHYLAILRETSEQVTEIENYFNILDLEADPDLQSMAAMITNVISRLGYSVDTMSAELLKFETGQDTSILSRIRWWLKQDEMAAGMARLQSQKHHAEAIQLTFLLRKMKEQGDVIMRLERHIGELRNGPSRGRGIA